jgi:hypothetical protein
MIPQHLQAAGTKYSKPYFQWLFSKKQNIKSTFGSDEYTIDEHQREYLRLGEKEFNVNQLFAYYMLGVS